MNTMEDGEGRLEGEAGWDSMMVGWMKEREGG